MDGSKGGGHNPLYSFLRNFLIAMAAMSWSVFFPWSLLWLRLLLAPAIVTCAWNRNISGIWLGAIMMAALLSDIYDGILARRLGTATTRLRVADSLVDTVFYIGVAVAVFVRHPELLRINAVWLSALVGLEIARYAFDWLKFGRMASYHSYLAKAWGLLLATAAIAALCLNRRLWLVTAAIIWGVACDVEGLLMSLVLVRWSSDVRTLYRAWQQRAENSAEQAR